MMHGAEKSDSAIVAGKPANKAEHPVTEETVRQPRWRSWGSQGVGRGECAAAQHALDPEPGSRVTGAGAHTKRQGERKKERFTALLKKRREITYWRKLTICKQLEAPFRVG